MVLELSNVFGIGLYTLSFKYSHRKSHIGLGLGTLGPFHPHKIKKNRLYFKIFDIEVQLVMINECFLIINKEKFITKLKTK